MPANKIGSPKTCNLLVFLKCYGGPNIQVIEQLHCYKSQLPISYQQMPGYKLCSPNPDSLPVCTEHLNTRVLLVLKPEHKVYEV